MIQGGGPPDAWLGMDLLKDKETIGDALYVSLAQKSGIKNAREPQRHFDRSKWIVGVMIAQDVWYLLIISFRGLKGSRERLDGV